jgi:hypothetical protein
MTFVLSFIFPASCVHCPSTAVTIPLAYRTPQVLDPGDAVKKAPALKKAPVLKKAPAHQKVVQPVCRPFVTQQAEADVAQVYVGVRVLGFKISARE